MPNATPTTTKQYQCRHIFTDGRRCASPCLRQEEFCYYHHTTRRPVADPRQRRSRRSTFDLPHPEDRSSIGEVLRRIASNEIDTKRAGLLLYGLQIASINLPRATPSGPAPKRRLYSYSDYLKADKEDTSETTLVKEFVVDPRFGILAPRTEIVEEERKLSVVGKLLKDLAEDRVRKTAAPAAKAASEASPEPPTPEPPTQPTILPSLQATATLLPLAVLLALQIRTVSSPRHPKKAVISTEVVRPHRTTQWRDPSISPMPLPVLDPSKSEPRLLSPTLGILTPDAQTNRPHHPRRLGLPPRNSRQRHRPGPQAHLRRPPPRLPQHPPPRQ